MIVLINMKNLENNYIGDEVDLGALLTTLWRGKFFIILVVTFFIICASFYLRSVERKYTVEYKLKSVSEQTDNSMSSSFGGLASLAGIQLPNKSGTDFDIFMELLNSVEVSEKVFENKKLIKKLFSREWNDSQGKYIEPIKSKKNKILAYIKILLSGNELVEYSPPNAQRLADFFTDNVDISLSESTGFLLLKSETSMPEDIILLIIATTRASDDLMRERYIKFSNEPLAFYKSKLRTARSREHREALAQLIGKEEQKLMFASNGKYFIAEPFLRPTVSSAPTTPKPNIVLALAILLGLSFGSGIVLIKNMKLKVNQ